MLINVHGALFCKEGILISLSLDGEKRANLTWPWNARFDAALDDMWKSFKSSAEINFCSTTIFVFSEPLLSALNVFCDWTNIFSNSNDIARFTEIQFRRFNGTSLSSYALPRMFSCVRICLRMEVPSLATSFSLIRRSTEFRIHPRLTTMLTNYCCKEIRWFSDY